MRWTQAALKTRARPCGRRSRVVLTPRRRRQVLWRQLRKMTVTRKPDHRGEHEISRKTIACGNAGCFRLYSRSRPVCFLPFAHGAAGAAGARHSPRPLWGGRFMHNPGASRRGIAHPSLHVIARRTCDEAIHPPLRPDGLLPPSLFELRRTSRFARNDGGLFEIESNNKHARRPGLEPGPMTTGRDVARG